MSNPPSRIPLNLQKGFNGTSYRDGITHKTEVRTPQDDGLDRNLGCTPLRRYPDGKLDIDYVAHQVIDIVHAAKNGKALTEFDRALLSLILPKQFQLTHPKIAGTMAKLSNDEIAAVGLKVMAHFGEELNWNAGNGGGSVPFRSTTLV